MRKPRRIVVLAAVLAAAAAWVALDALRPAGATRRSAVVTEASAKSMPGRLAETITPWDALPARDGLGVLKGNPLGELASVAPPPAAKPPVAAPVPPAAPPFPFRFVGRLWLPDGTQLLLGRGDDAFVVKRGDILDGQYRVEALSATELVIVHVPTETRTTIQFGVPDDELRIAANPQ
jgi:hypothetical protein